MAYLLLHPSADCVRLVSGKSLEGAQAELWCTGLVGDDSYLRSHDRLRSLTPSYILMQSHVAKAYRGSGQMRWSALPPNLDSPSLLAHTATELFAPLGTRPTSEADIPAPQRAIRGRYSCQNTCWRSATAAEYLKSASNSPAVPLGTERKRRQQTGIGSNWHGPGLGNALPASSGKSACND